MATSGSSGSPYTFAATSGYRSDGDAGLTHVGARYYDAQVGRFVTRDTLLDQHPYLYCDHDPVNAVDPSGHESEGLEFEVNMARAIAEKDVDGAGTLIEAISDDDTAHLVEGTLRDAFRHLPKRMSKVPARWKQWRHIIDTIYKHVKILDRGDERDLVHHLGEIGSSINEFGRKIRLD